MKIDKIKILILDADQESLDIFRKFFDLEFFDLSITSDCDQAKNLYKNKDFSIIFSELFINQKLTTPFINYLIQFGSHNIPLFLINSHFDENYQERIKLKGEIIQESFKKPIQIQKVIKSLELINFFSTNKIKFKQGKMIADDKIIFKSDTIIEEKQNIKVKSLSNSQSIKESTNDMITLDNIEKLDNENKSLHSNKKPEPKIDKDVNSRDKLGKTPLMIFCEQGNIKNVEVLLSHDAKLELKCKKGRTAFHYACSSNNIALIKFLIDKGSKINSRDSENLDPLYFAVINSANMIIQELIKRGANVNGRVKNKSYLMLAVLKNNLRAVKLLLAAGINANSQDDKGKTALMIAKSKKFTKIVQYLEALNKLKKMPKKAA